MNEIDIIINQFVLDGGKLYTLPKLYQQLEQKIYSSTASIDEFAKILRTDGALSAKLLKLANSALYGFRSEISTLNQALTLIGLKEVQSLILMDSISRHINQNNCCSSVEMESFWLRSIHFGLIAKRLAKKLKHPEADHLFISGLMSRLGQLVCCYSHSKKVLDVLHEHINSPNVKEYCIEKKYFNFTYNEISATLLEHWQIPNKIIFAIRYLHQPDNIDEEGFYKDAMILNVANSYSGILELDSLQLSDSKMLNIPDSTAANTYIKHVEPEINQALSINESIVEDILFEIEMDSLQMLAILLPKI